MLNINTFLLKTKNILYVEDDKDTADEISFFLRNYTNTLYVASDGAEGLELFKKHHIDLIITDIQMPVMDGISMIKSIKVFDAHVPIIITTAFNETNYLIEALNLGIDKYVLKPVNLKDLLKNIVQLIEEFEVIDYGYYLDTDANIIGLSQQLLQYIGYKKEEVIGRSSFDFVKEEDIQRIKEQFEILRSGIAIENIRFFLKRKDNLSVEVLLNASPILNADGSIEKIYCEISSLDTYIRSKTKLEKAFEKEHALRELITMESKIAQNIAHEKSVDSFLENTMRIIEKYGKYTFAFISLNENEVFRLVSQMKHPFLDIGQILGEVFTFKDAKNSLCDRCHNLLENHITIINDIQEIPYFKEKEQFLSAGIHSVLSLPIYSVNAERVTGIMSFFFGKVYHLSKDEMNMYKNISETIALGIESIEMKLEKEYLIKELEYQVNTDQLTKATNRRRAFEILKQEIERSSRYKNIFSMIYLDIDNFKAINDLYGHKEGDKALIQLSQIFQSMLRLTDTFARWGGEEFIVILPEIKKESARAIAEKLRQELEQKTNFTASFGVIQYEIGDGVDSLIMRADKKMYQAKMAGKNRVVCD